jgi:hypothetical protein
MPLVGAFLAREEHGTPALVRQAQMAEAAPIRGAGSDEICVNQIGPERKGFFSFSSSEIEPHLGL